MSKTKDTPYDNLKKTVRSKLGKNLNLNSFNLVCRFLQKAGAQTVITAFPPGISGYCIRLPHNKLRLLISAELDDDEKLVVALHEFVEGHLDRPENCLDILGMIEVLLSRFDEREKTKRKRLANPFEGTSVDVFFNGLRAYLFGEGLTWWFCGELIYDAKLSDHRRNKLLEIVKRKLSDWCLLSNVLQRYDFRIWKLLRGESGLPLQIEKEVQLGLMRDFAALMSYYVKSSETCNEKQQAQHQSRLNKMLCALEELKERLGKGDPDTKMSI